MFYNSFFHKTPPLGASALYRKFRNCYWEDLAVILLTLTNLSKRLNTYIKAYITCSPEKQLKKVLAMV